MILLYWVTSLNSLILVPLSILTNLNRRYIFLYSLARLISISLFLFTSISIIYLALKLMIILLLIILYVFSLVLFKLISHLSNIFDMLLLYVVSFYLYLLLVIIALLLNPYYRNVFAALIIISYTILLLFPIYPRYSSNNIVSIIINSVNNLMSKAVLYACCILWGNISLSSILFRSSFVTLMLRAVFLAISSSILVMTILGVPIEWYLFSKVAI